MDLQPPAYIGVHPSVTQVSSRT